MLYEVGRANISSMKMIVTVYEEIQFVSNIHRFEVMRITSFFVQLQCTYLYMIKARKQFH